MEFHHVGTKTLDYCIQRLILAAQALNLLWAPIPNDDETLEPIAEPASSFIGAGTGGSHHFSYNVPSNSLTFDSIRFRTSRNPRPGFG